MFQVRTIGPDRLTDGHCKSSVKDTYVQKGCARISSREGRSEGLMARHFRMRSFTSLLMFPRKAGQAKIIFVSEWKGMSPQTMSNSKIPRDQTAAG